MFTRFDTTSGRLAVSAMTGGHDEREDGGAGEAQGQQHADGKQAPAVVPAERRPNPCYGVPVEGGARNTCSSALAASAIDCSS